MKKHSDSKTLALAEVHTYSKGEFEKLKQASLQKLQKDMAAFTKTFQTTAERYLENYFKNVEKYVQKLQKEKVQNVHQRLQFIIKNMESDLK